MDLAQIERDLPDTKTITIEVPGHGTLYDDNGNPSTITVYSPASDEAVNYNRKVQRRASNRIAKRGLKGIKLSSDEIEKQNIERLCAYTASVDFLMYSGEQVTVDSIEEIYKNPRFSWLNEQVSDVLASWDDFLA